MTQYIIGIDQSTQGTKALVFDDQGNMLSRCDRSHQQIINDKGWVEHNPEEIYANTIQVVKDAVEKAGIDKKYIASIGISNQRETALLWKKNGKPVYNAVVWQCARAEEICRKAAEQKIDGEDADLYVREHTGLPISPYFPAGKISWLLQNAEGAQELAKKGELLAGTVDAFLVYRLTKGREFRTDASNASRTELLDIRSFTWDKKICDLFHIPVNILPTVTDSDGLFGETDLEGYLDQPVPIHGVLGDSHGALFGQDCTTPGMMKATYGTGSSVMMNIGCDPVFSKNGLVTSAAWRMHGKVEYVLEGNINYTGAVISWLKDNLKLIVSAKETEDLAREANPQDTCYFVPAFTGLGSPYWNADARAQITNMSRTTGKNEIIRAALDCIGYQIGDIVKAMQEDSGIRIKEIRADGGPTRNRYLMEFQSNICGIPVNVPEAEELSGIGAAYAAGIGQGIYGKEVLKKMHYTAYQPSVTEKKRETLIQGWKRAVHAALTY